MITLSSKDRIKRMYEHRDADRIPVFDYPWENTIKRWQKEGMPSDVNYVDYFGLDKVTSFGVDITPRYDENILEETDDYTIHTSNWGVTMKSWKNAASTPQFLDYKIKTPDDWSKAKQRMLPTRDRIDWKALKANYKIWKREGHWLEAGFWFGFDVTHSWTIGTERMLVAMAIEPEWITDMFDHYLNMCIDLWDQIIDAGYEFDAITWPDDMGYKFNTFFSIDMYRNLLKPYHKKAINWAHSKGLKAHLHSCGDIHTFIPDLLEIGLDALNPLEVKAGMDPIKLKDKYGDKLVLHGGINAVLWDKKDEIEAEMRLVVPKLKESGGYIFSSDHSVPDAVSLDNFRYIIDLAKKLGKY